MDYMMDELPIQCSDLKVGQVLGFLGPLIALSLHQIIRMIYYLSLRVRREIWPRVWPRLSMVVLDTTVKAFMGVRDWFNTSFPPL